MRRGAPNWRLLVTEVSILAALALVAAVFIPLSQGGGGVATTRAAVRKSSPTVPPRRLAPAQTTPSSTAAPRSAAAASTTPIDTAHPATSMPAPAAPGTGPVASGGSEPVISSVSPAGGAPGQTIMVSGTGFFSPDTGQVVASFDGVAAATNCPVQTSCIVTVPQLPGSPASVELTVSTQSGTSNPVALAFDPT